MTIQKSALCACFYCMAIFPWTEIEDWIRGRESDALHETALCPKCGIDAVIGDADVRFDETFLKDMNEHWFI